MELEQAKEFCERWLPAWTGNRPDLLISFYCETPIPKANNLKVTIGVAKLVSCNETR